MKEIEWYSKVGSLEHLEVHHIMEVEVETCTPANSALAIAFKICQGNFGSIPVVDEHNTLLGLVTEFDLLRAIEDNKGLQNVNVADIMTREVITVEENTPVLDLIRLIQKHHLIRVPVVRENELIGIVARRDMLYGYILSLKS
jgi:CBS domain-containing protein